MGDLVEQRSLVEQENVEGEEGEGGRRGGKGVMRGPDTADRQTKKHQGISRLVLKVATHHQSNGTDTRS